ncbi:MAG: flagellar basal-body protein FlbY [Alphaproteobacteria bacterium]|nr:flagellar basal-body protein FlbY [Alphaproteobacteria bacterium]MBU3974173.1 flagellar basal-body protein FlbY [Alphaproteobacteria bacterium]MBU4039529.1 flagellar basal-body protein FlbY [Alphaproteobacteria bacterium]MBU4136908.1 flagellar basal-body protein FlbY [Alphaproteobacteria bacterium]
MTEAVAVNAAARVRQLTDLTNRLTASLTEESRAFEARRPQDAAASLAGTQDLANAYRRESAQIKANPAAIAAAPAADRTALIRATEAFEAVLSRHARAVEAARIVSEGLVRTIAAEVAGQRGSPSAYGASGKATAGDGRAVAFNRQA